MIKIKKGLDLPIMGNPEQAIYDGQKCKSVAILGDDYPGMKPTMKVKIGDTVKKGDLIFVDKKCPAIRFTAPGAGKVSLINRGARRVFESVVIELDATEDEQTFTSYSVGELETLGSEKVKSLLLESGLWTAFKTRPFSKIPDPETTPHSIFINTMDTNPLCADSSVIINDKKDAFINGVKVISNLTSGKKYLCKSLKSSIPGSDLPLVEVKEFSGPHPAGNVGTHIHNVDPVNLNKTVWTISYQDVIAFGELFISGKLNIDRVISLAGSKVIKPRLVRTRLGGSLGDLLIEQVKDGDNRVISGSVLSGHHAYDSFNYLGRYHNQVTVIGEGKGREFLGWMMPGLGKFSIKNLYASTMISKRNFDFNTNINGGARAMVPIGSYEKVMPLDILPTFLLRALIVKDTDNAQELGCLELDEEDLALCTFVCPSKYDYGSILRENLTIIEKDG